MVLYGLKNCDTCRKALKELPDAEFVDVRKDGISREILADAFECLGEGLMNTRSTTWRNLSEEQRAISPLQLLVDHPALMKRPLIRKDGKWFLGWTPIVREALGAQ